MKKHACPIRLTLIACFLILTPMLLAASGQSEEEKLNEARALMEANRHREALILLTEIREANPDLREITQAYIDESFSHIARVNEIQQKILEAYDNLDEAQELEYMEKLKEYDRVQFEKFYAVSYERKNLARNRKLFFDFMDEAYAMIEQREWREALEVYQKGFSIYRDEFYENEKYTNIIRSSVQSLFKEIDALVIEYYSKAEVAEKSAQALHTLIAEKRLTESLSRGEGFSRELSAFLELRRRMTQLGTRLISQNENLKQFGNETFGDYFLAFSSQVVLGRTGSTHREGMYFVFEKHWEMVTEEAISLYRQNTDQYFMTAWEQGRKSMWDQADADFALAGKYAFLGAEILSQYVNTASVTAPQKIDERDKAVILGKYPLYLYFLQRELEVRLLRSVMTFSRSYEALTGRALGDFAAMEKTRLEAGQIIETLAGYSSLLEKRKDYFTQLASYGYNVTEASGSLSQTINRIEEVLGAYQKLEIEYALRFVERDYNTLRDSLADKEKRFSQAKEWREGAAALNAEEEAGKKFPSRALEVYLALQTELNNLANLTADFFSRYRNGEEDVRIKNFLSQASQLEAGIKTLREKLNDEVSIAASQKKRADELWELGRVDYREAENSFKNRDYAKTLEELEQSDSHIVSSLSNEENAARRKFLAEELDRLRKATIEANINRRLTAYRKSLNQGQQLYFLNDFDGANRALLDAKRQLEESTLSGEALETDDDEISFWLDLVRRALNLNLLSNREISEKHPLYAVIATRQNNAARNYQTGLTWQTQGNTEEAFRNFKNARDELEQIKKDFPYLKESGVLYLRIIKAEDDALYKTRRSDILNNPENKQDLRKALSDLEDLKAIEPNYPGLDLAIRRVNDKLFPKPQVGREERERAAQRYDDALRLYRTFNRNNLRLAKDFINEALRLNPYSDASQKLKDKILYELRPQ